MRNHGLGSNLLVSVLIIEVQLYRLFLMQMKAVEPLLMDTSPQYQVFGPCADPYFLLNSKPALDHKTTSVLMSVYSALGRPSKKDHLLLYF